MQTDPGITDPAAILYFWPAFLIPRDRDIFLPRKLDLYEEYVRTRTFWGNLKILGQTAIAIIAGARGAHASGDARRESRQKPNKPLNNIRDEAVMSFVATIGAIPRNIPF